MASMMDSLTPAFMHKERNRGSSNSLPDNATPVEEDKSPPRLMVMLWNRKKNSFSGSKESK